MDSRRESLDVPSLHGSILPASPVDDAWGPDDRADAPPETLASLRSHVPEHVCVCWDTGVADPRCCGRAQSCHGIDAEVEGDSNGCTCDTWGPVDISCPVHYDDLIISDYDEQWEDLTHRVDRLESNDFENYGKVQKLAGDLSDQQQRVEDVAEDQKAKNAAIRDEMVRSTAAMQSQIDMLKGSFQSQLNNAFASQQSHIETVRELVVARAENAEGHFKDLRNSAAQVTRAGVELSNLHVSPDWLARPVGIVSTQGTVAKELKTRLQDPEESFDACSTRLKTTGVEVSRAQARQKEKFETGEALRKYRLRNLERQYDRLLTAFDSLQEELKAKVWKTESEDKALQAVAERVSGVRRFQGNVTEL